MRASPRWALMVEGAADGRAGGAGLKRWLAKSQARRNSCTGAPSQRDRRAVVWNSSMPFSVTTIRRAVSPSTSRAPAASHQITFLAGSSATQTSSRLGPSPRMGMRTSRTRWPVTAICRTRGWPCSSFGVLGKKLATILPPSRISMAPEASRAASQAKGARGAANTRKTAARPTRGNRRGESTMTIR